MAEMRKCRYYEQPGTVNQCHSGRLVHSVWLNQLALAVNRNDAIEYL